MDPTILAAIIGGLATVGGSIVAVVITRVLDNPMGFKKNMRQMALAGHWEGTVHQEGWPADYHLSFSLKPVGRTIRGEGRVVYSDPNREIDELITLFGGFVHDRFLKLEYEMQAQPGSVQFGFTLLELSPDGQTLSGPFLGFGANVTRGFVNGIVQVHRRKSTAHSRSTSHTSVSP